MVLIRWLLFVITTRRYTIVGRRVAALRTTVATVAISLSVPVVCLVSADSPQSTAQSSLTLAKLSISCFVNPTSASTSRRYVWLSLLLVVIFNNHRLGPYISSFHRLFRKVSAVFNNISLKIDHSFKAYTLLLICLIGVGLHLLLVLSTRFGINRKLF